MILVAGATGRLGGLVVRRLLADGRPVRILVRPQSEHADLVDLGAEPVLADLKDPASVRAACAGVDAVVTTANAVGRGGDDTIDSVDRQGNRHLVDAAEASGVRRFVFVSVLGADAASPVPLVRAKAETEQHLASSSMAWTVLQPNLFMDTWLPMVVGGPALAGAPVTLVGEGRRRHSMVAMADVASYALAVLDRAQAHGKRLVIGGPEPLSWHDAVAAFEMELGHDVTVRMAGPGDGVPGMPDEVVPLFHALEQYDSPIDMTATSAAYGVTPTSLGDFVASFVASLRTS